MFYINGRFLTQPITGVNRFALEICKSLKVMKVRFSLIVPEWYNYNNEYGFDLVYYGKLKSHFWEQVDLLRFLKTKKSPLLLNLSGLGPIFYSNQVITIHDLSFYVNPNWFSFFYRKFYGIVTPVLAKKSKAILTVSLFSKSEIIKYLPVKDDKITVIYNAVSEFSLNQNSQNANKLNDRKYILAVSSLDARKNHQILIDAFNCEEFTAYDLLLVGKSAKHFKFNLSEYSGKENIKFLGYVTDNELSNLYHNATVFIYPSLYEGFGIPPLEAMAHSCPVIVSDITVFREVCGDAAVYVDPENIDSVRKGILNVLNNERLRVKLIDSGKNRVKQFSWMSSAEKVSVVIKDIL